MHGDGCGRLNADFYFVDGTPHMHRSLSDSEVGYRAAVHWSCLALGAIDSPTAWSRSPAPQYAAGECRLANMGYGTVIKKIFGA